MRRKHVKLGIVSSMMVTKEEYLGALGELTLQKTLHIGDYTAGLCPTIKGITLFQETPEHIHD
jgi:hypothetical protein